MDTLFYPGLQTREIKLNISQAGSLRLRVLQDSQQYSDPGGLAARMGVSPALWPLSGLLWPSAYYLASELALRPVNPGEHMLEIGCGLALPSLICYRKAARITVSDHNPLSHYLLEKNLKLNRLAPGLAFRYGHWGSQAGLQLPAHFPRLGIHEKYDFIAGSDLLYEPSSAQDLSRFINRHAHPRARVWIVDASRGYRGAFKRHMAGFGFRLKEKRILNRKPCLSGAPAYKGCLLKFWRTSAQS